MSSKPTPAHAGPNAVLQDVQILRFVAAAMVLVSHLQHEVPSVRGLDAAGYVPFTPVWFPGGVDIFFVISGFIMMLIAGDRFGAPGASKEFIGRRLLRVAPPYWLFTTAMVAATLLFAEHVAHSKMLPGHVLASYLFVPLENAYGQLYPVLILGWTLNFEMLFYVLFALGLMLRRPAGLWFIGLAITALGVTGWIGLPTTAPDPLRFWCNPIVFEFLFGIGIGWAYRRGVRLPGAAVLGLVVVSLGAMVAASVGGIAGHRAWELRTVWMGVPAALLVAAAALARRSVLSGLPGHGLLVRGGDVSFALYLSHPFSLTIVAALWRHTGIAEPVVYVAAAGLFSLLCAWGVWRWLEQPLLRRLQRAKPAGGGASLRAAPAGVGR